MNEKLANRVKELRCGPITHSCRRIAEVISAEFSAADCPGLTYTDEDGRICGIQMEGKELCDAAAKFFNEDPNSEGWN